MARLLSVNVGLPRDIERKGRTVHTGIWKDPVRGRCRVGRVSSLEICFLEIVVLVRPPFTSTHTRCKLGVGYLVTDKVG
jgi:hypothetical protein